MSGRPPFWTPEKKMAARVTICAAIADGKSLRSVCKASDMPDKTTVLDWLSDDPAFATQYARARELGADENADEIIEISDTELDSNRARVRIDARKWHSSKMHPRKYGERLQLDGDLKVKLDDEQIDARLSQLLGKTGAVAAIGGKGTPEEAA